LLSHSKALSQIHKQNAVIKQQDHNVAIGHAHENKLEDAILDSFHRTSHTQALQPSNIDTAGGAATRSDYAALSGAGLLKLAGLMRGYSPTRSGMWKALYLASTV